MVVTGVNGHAEDPPAEPTPFGYPPPLPPVPIEIGTGLPGAVIFG